jgi:hypothetical protein
VSITSETNSHSASSSFDSGKSSHNYFTISTRRKEKRFESYPAFPEGDNHFMEEIADRYETAKKIAIFMDNLNTYELVRFRRQK